jgi:type IV secretion system protein VirB4
MLAKKQQVDLQDKLKIHDFIPFACHYSSESILTKNGELIQFIKLDQDAGANDDEFRQAIRDSLNAVIDPAKYAVWIHTTRTRQEIKKLNSKNISKQVEFEWRRTLPEKLHFENAIYISVVRDSSAFSMLNPRDYIMALSQNTLQNHNSKELAKKDAELTNLMNKVHANLERFGAAKLKVYEKDGVHYSEPMEFLHRILSFFDEHVEMPLSDLSYNLMPEEITFNEFTGIVEVDSERGKNYASVITLKECGLLPARSLDYLLNIDSEMVISQSMDFATANTRLHNLRYQEEVDKYTEDKEFAKIIGIKDVDSSNADNFVLQQTNILLMQPSKAKLRQTLVSVHKELARLGLIGITEDIRLEKAFWAIAPSNFMFLKRQDIVPRKDIGNFAILGNDIYQEIEASLFGDPVIFFESQDGEPYPFHFINNGSGHVLIASEYEEQRNAFLHLVGVHLKKFPCHIIYYDEKGKYADFAEEIGAEYVTKFDFDYLKAQAEKHEKLVILFNSLDVVIESAGAEFFCNFLEFLGENDTIMLACAKYVSSHIDLLTSFDSQIFFNAPDIKKYAGNFDLFDDEVKIITLLEDRGIYVKHNYEEVILKYALPDNMAEKLLHPKGGEANSEAN